MPVQNVLDRTKDVLETSERPVLHDWGLFEVRGSALLPAAHGSLAFKYAQEALIYNSRHLGPWKVDQVDVGTYEALSQMCVNRTGAPFEGIVVAESSGCAHVAFDMTGDAQGATWTLETLARQGTNWGQPREFWYSKPAEHDPPEGITCDTRVVVQVDILSLESFCSQVVVPLQIARLTDALKQNQSELVQVRTKLAELEKNLAAAAQTIDQAQRATTSETLKLEQARQRVALLESTIQDLKRKVDTAAASATAATQSAPALEKVVLLAEQAESSAKPTGP